MEFPEALQVVYRALDLVNELRAPGDQIPKTPSVRLAGDGGCLDSLALATLALAVERDVATTAGREIVLLGDDDFELNLTFFSTAEDLARLIMQKAA